MDEPDAYKDGGVRPGAETARVAAGLDATALIVTAETLELSADESIALTLITAAPSAATGHCLVMHGYGGSKEELWGLGSRLSLATGMTCVLPDLPGHGESAGRFDLSSVTLMMELITARFRPQLAVGHSIGARIVCRLAGSRRAIAISPPLGIDEEMDRRTLISSLRPARVREESTCSGLRECLAYFQDTLRDPDEVNTETLVLRASNDLNTVNEGFLRWTGQGGVDTADPVPASTHLDILTHPMTWDAMRRWLVV